MTTKNIIWIVLVVLVIGLLILARGFKKNTSQTNPNNASLKTSVVTITPTVSVSGNASPTATAATTNQTAAVTYNGSSFSPATLTVKSGTKVTFTNDSDQPMWVASNPHPTHADLSGFDSLTTLKKSQSYTFTFVKVGSWGYHNHLSTSQGGTVVVQ